MSQVTDRTVGANPSGFDMRTELNNIIAALESDNSGSSEPLNPAPYMKWLDTSNATYYYYKERNHDNTAWVTLFRYTVATKIMEVVNNGTDLTTILNLKANLANPIFTGSVTLPVPTLVNQAISMGNILEKTGAGIGYGTGSGGTVTQLTSKSTSVTLNKPTGQITMNAAALAAGASITFTLSNTTISTNDLVFVLINSNDAYSGAHSVFTSDINNTYCAINVKNNSASSQSLALILSFIVIKGTTA